MNVHSLFPAVMRIIAAILIFASNSSFESLLIAKPRTVNMTGGVSDWIVHEESGRVFAALTNGNEVVEFDLAEEIAKGVPPTSLRTLFPDVEWCEQIVWSPDSQHVAFVVEEAEVEVYDTKAERLRPAIWLVPRRGEYPPAAVVRDLSLLSGGRAVTFRTCPRRDDPTKPLSKDLWDGAYGPCSTVQHTELEGVSGASGARR